MRRQKDIKNAFFLLEGLVKETGYAEQGAGFVFPGLQAEVGRALG